MDEVLRLFKPDNVFALVFFLTFIGLGIFISRNWKDILGFLERREENRHKEQLAKQDSGEMTREALANLTRSVAEVNQIIGRHTLETQKVVLKVDVLVQVIERIAERMGNGYSHQKDTGS